MTTEDQHRFAALLGRWHLRRLDCEDSSYRAPDERERLRAEVAAIARCADELRTLLAALNHEEPPLP